MIIIIINSFNVVNKACKSCTLFKIAFFNKHVDFHFSKAVESYVVFTAF